MTLQIDFGIHAKLLAKGRCKPALVGITHRSRDFFYIQALLVQQLTSSFHAMLMQITKYGSAKHLTKTDFKLVVVQAHLTSQFHQRRWIIQIGGENFLGVTNASNVVTL